MEEQRRAGFYLPRALQGRVHFDEPAGGGEDPAAKAAADKAAADAKAKADADAAAKAEADAKAAADKAAADQAKDDEAFERHMAGIEKYPERVKRAQERLAGKTIGQLTEDNKRLNDRITNFERGALVSTAAKKHGLDEHEAGLWLTGATAEDLDRQGKAGADYKKKILADAAEKGKGLGANRGSPKLPDYTGPAAKGTKEHMQWLEDEFVKDIEENGAFAPVQ